MKVAIIGYSGAGKSTLAGSVGNRLGLSPFHLDRAQFTAGWLERPRAEALAMVEAELEQDDWVVDGNYPDFHFERRIAQADLILILDFPRLLCLFQALGRWLRYRGRTRESMAEGCPERIDWAFLSWLIWFGRSPQRAALFASILERYPKKSIRLRTRREVALFLAHFPVQES